MVGVVIGGRLAVIPARGGSKRLPGKNTRSFHGRPLVAYTIDAARDSGLFDRVLVSTDDPATAEIAARLGCPPPFLRDRYADDESTASDATCYAVEQLAAREGEEYATVVQLMASCPLRGAAHIRSAVASFEAGDADFQVSCSRYGWANPWWAVRRLPDGRPRALLPESYGSRSQDLEELYCPTGAVWIARWTELRVHRTFYGPSVVFEPMPWRAAIDIDTPDDWELAEALFAWQGREGS